MSFSDADLIARVLVQEDQNAFGELVRRHQSAVRGFLIHLNRGDSHAADDQAQETFLKVWSRLKTFRSEGKFSTWLFGIACNEWKMHQRRRREISVEDLGDNPAMEAAQVDPGAENRMRMDLESAMKTLTMEENAAILLCYQNGFSHEEAAKLLEIPLGTVKTNILRGKEKLRRCLSL